MGACNSKAPAKSNAKKPEKGKGNQNDQNDQDPIDIQNIKPITVQNLDHQSKPNDQSIQLDGDEIAIGDALKYLQSGDLEMLRKVLTSHNIRDCSFIRGLNQQFEWTTIPNRPSESMNNWNPLQICLALGHHDIVTYLVDQGAILYQNQICSSFENPHIIDTKANFEQFIAGECKALEIAIEKKDAISFDKVWNTPLECGSSFAWSQLHFEYLLQLLNQTQFVEGIKMLSQSSYIKKYLNDNTGNLDQLIKDEIKNEPANMTSYEKELQNLDNIRDKILLDQNQDLSSMVIVDHVSIRQVFDEVATKLLGHSYEPAHKYHFSELHQVMFDSYKNQEPQKILEYFQKHADNHDNLNQQFRVINQDSEEKFIYKDHFMFKSFVLLWAVHQNHNELVQYILSNQHNFLRLCDLMVLFKALVLNQKDIDATKPSWTRKCLQLVLQSPVMKGIFTNLQPEERAQLSGWMFDLCKGNSKLLAMLILNFSDKPYASYLLLYYCNREVYKKIVDFSHFDKAFDNASKMELEQISESVYGEQVKQFINFVVIQEPGNPLYDHGFKVVSMIQQTSHFNDVQYDDTAMLDNESMIIEEEVLDLNFSNVAPKLGQPREYVTVNQIEKALKNKDVQFFKQAIQTSKESTHGMLLLEHLFMDFAEGYEIYVGDLQKTELKLEDYNLIQVMLAIQFDFDLLDSTLNELTFLNSYNQSKKLPQLILLVCSGSRFKHSINNVLKMAASNPAAHNIVSDFIIKRFNEQLMTLENLKSLFKFLIQNRKQEILDDLSQSQLVNNVLQNSSYDQIDLYKNAMEHLYQIHQDQVQFEWTFQQVEAYHSKQQWISDLDSLYALQTVLESGEVQDRQEFINLLQQSAKGLQDEAGFDARIRFDSDQYIKSEEIQNIQINKSQIGLVLYSILYHNLDALKIILEMDKSICLRNALRGQIIDRVKSNKFWRYKCADNDQEAFEFDSLGLALLADCGSCSNDEKEKHLGMLVQLIKNPGFVISQRDYVSFVKVCHINKNRLMLRTFLQCFEMQIVFISLKYQQKRDIMRMLIIESSFEPSITLRQPYALYCLSLLIQYPDKVKKNNDVAKELLTNISDERLHLLIQLDPVLVDNVIEAVDTNKFDCYNLTTKEQILKIINRIKQEELQNRSRKQTNIVRINTNVNEVHQIVQDENRESAILEYEKSLPPVKEDNNDESEIN